MIKRRECKTYIEHLYCEECGCEMEFTGEVLLSNPERYVHRCPKCDNTEWKHEYYPRTVQEEIGPEEEVV